MLPDQYLLRWLPSKRDFQPEGLSGRFQHKTYDKVLKAHDR